MLLRSAVITLFLKDVYRKISQGLEIMRMGVKN